MASAKERLDVLLVSRGLCETRARAQARIMAGEVVVGDHRVDKPGTRVLVDAEIRFKGEALPWVSRGALKLVAALEAFAVDVAGKVCLDVGASTGGFTEVLLARGAQRVFAVDVGTNQLAYKLRQDPRVVSLEKTHIAKLTPGSLPEMPTVGVVDVSFISLTKVLPAMLAHLDPDAVVVALIKPQFEAGKNEVGKGGIVRDPEVRERAVAMVLDAASTMGLSLLGRRESPITGTDGNVEVLAAWRRAPSA